MRKIIIMVLFTILCDAASAQRGYHELVRFNVPLGSSEETAKNIIKTHNYSIANSYDEEGLHFIVYKWGGSWVSIGIGQGLVKCVRWNYNGNYDYEGYVTFDAIHSYLEEDLHKKEVYTDHSGWNPKYYYTNLYYCSQPVGAILTGKSEGLFSSGSVTLTFYSVQYVKNLVRGFREKERAEVRQREQERQAEELRQRSEQFASMVAKAREKHRLGAYSEACAMYQEAVKFWPEKRSEILQEYNASQAALTRKEADRLFRERQIGQARDRYRMLAALDSTQSAYAQGQMTKLDEMERLVTERLTTIYDYRTVMPEAYRAAQLDLQDSILHYIGRNSVAPCTVTLHYTISLQGMHSRQWTVSTANAALKNHLEQMQIELPMYECYDMAMPTDAVFTITVGASEKQAFRASRSVGGAYPAEYAALMPAYGSYRLCSTQVEIDGERRATTSVLTYKNTGGPENAWLSLLVPGLGQHRVTYGAKSGLSTTVGVYGLVAAGVGMRFWSNSEYNRYHQATNQTDMDTYYSSAESKRNASTYLFVAAGVWWMYDILNVLAKGRMNIGKYGRGYMAYMPQNDALAVGYTLNF